MRFYNFSLQKNDSSLSLVRSRGNIFFYFIWKCVLFDAIFTYKNVVPLLTTLFSLGTFILSIFYNRKLEAYKSELSKDNILMQISYSELTKKRYEVIEDFVQELILVNNKFYKDKTNLLNANNYDPIIDNFRTCKDTLRLKFLVIQLYIPAEHIKSISTNIDLIDEVYIEIRRLARSSQTENPNLQDIQNKFLEIISQLNEMESELSKLVKFLNSNYFNPNK